MVNANANANAASSRLDLGSYSQDSGMVSEERRGRKDQQREYVQSETKRECVALNT